MDTKERDKQLLRVKTFNELDARETQIRAALSAVTEDDPKGPCGQGPFTGNIRESRRVTSLKICFSATLGGSPEVDKWVDSVNISAGRLGAFLKKELEEQLAAIRAEKDKL